jgi:hypothetical protein
MSGWGVVVKEIADAMLRQKLTGIEGLIGKEKAAGEGRE